MAFIEDFYYGNLEPSECSELGKEIKEKLDELILLARRSMDQSYRKTLYRECLEIIGDWAVEIPMYQRQNLVIFSPRRIDLESLTPDMTTFWSWEREIERLQMR